ncbi:hypothetical protein Goari_001521 [Gossypium aridum]|uniref:Beta-galactosidase galactose-binding domain-containing protein n=1 Tax=Gossypium aridum TaxID=34290 RepID=A0A7J8YK19_GOSAI|nr:hypothetical protein [Gossypium aridum]
MANDASDYLWYKTSNDVAKDDPILNGIVTLHVNDTGHVLHVFFKGEYIARISSPIELVLNKNFVKGLSSNKWTYKVGLNETLNKFSDTYSASKSSSTWIFDPIPVDRNFTWIETCDYRGRYSDSKCVSKCGEPTQRWYHVPRSFLKDGENTLVLFEKFGGNPSGVQFQTVETGSVCINTHKGKEVK